MYGVTQVRITCGRFLPVTQRWTLFVLVCPSVWYKYHCYLITRTFFDTFFFYEWRIWSEPPTEEREWSSIVDNFFSIQLFIPVMTKPCSLLTQLGETIHPTCCLRLRIISSTFRDLTWSVLIVRVNTKSQRTESRSESKSKGFISKKSTMHN